MLGALVALSCLGEQVVLGAESCGVSFGCVGDDVLLRCICARVGVGERVRAGVVAHLVVCVKREEREESELRNVGG